MRPLILTTLALLVLGGPLAVHAEPDPYVQEIEAWRANRVKRLESDTGWLTVCGFHWLTARENGFGTDPTNAVVLPDGPAFAGTFIVEGSGETALVRVELADGVEASVDGKPVRERVLAADTPGPPDELRLGRLTLWIARRAGTVAVRVRDPECRLRKEFHGITSWPVDAAWRTTGRYEPFAEAVKIEVPNAMGYVDTSAFHGRVRFTLQGREMSLVPIVESASDSVFFFVFGDETTGRETYGGGRFLYGDLAPDGTVVLDFNKAYNPPCAFNEYTTCPLPPTGNTLPVAVRAGEKDYHGGGR